MVAQPRCAWPTLPGRAAQSSISDLRYAIFRAEIFSLRGNKPAFSLRHRVTGESCEIVSTSLGRRKTGSKRAIKITFHLVITPAA